MASWATFRFHSGVMAGGFTNVILWIIYVQEKNENTFSDVIMLSEIILIFLSLTCLICSQKSLVTEDPE